MIGQIGSLHREHIFETKRGTLYTSQSHDAEKSAPRGHPLIHTQDSHTANHCSFLYQFIYHLPYSGLVADGFSTFHSTPPLCPIAMPRIPHEGENIPGALTNVAAQ